MQICFFEEFPKKWEKLRYISWNSKIYVAAPSLKDFLTLRSQILKHKNIRKIVYWPILEKREGYWISPFSRKSALERIFGELTNSKEPVMLDLELPTTRNAWLYLTESSHFFHNKKLIRSFIQHYKGEVNLVEYYPNTKRKEKILTWFGLHYPSSKVRIIKMVYHSIHTFKKEALIRQIKDGIAQFKHNYVLALGTIAKGVQGDEPILAEEQLKHDLHLAQEHGLSEVIIYSLSGLNQKYQKVLKEYAED